MQNLLKHPALPVLGVVFGIAGAGIGSYALFASKAAIDLEARWRQSAEDHAGAAIEADRERISRLGSVAVAALCTVPGAAAEADRTCIHVGTEKLGPLHQIVAQIEQFPTLARFAGGQDLEWKSLGAVASAVALESGTCGAGASFQPEAAGVPEASGAVTVLGRCVSGTGET